MIIKDRMSKKRVPTNRLTSDMRANHQIAEQTSKREQILDAAVRVFSTRGYRATLVDEIAQEAGVAKGTLYLYFASKEEMYFQAFRVNVEKLHEATIVRMEEVSSTWDKIKAFITVRLEFGETHKEFLRIYLSEFAGTFTGKGEWSEQLNELLRRESDLLRNLFRQGIEAREVRAVPADQLVSMLHYMVAGVMASRVTAIRITEAELNPDLIVDLLRKGLGLPQK